MFDYEAKAGQSYHFEEFDRHKKPGLGAKVKAHFKRFWWLYLIFFICSILIIVLCLVYVGFPRMAQDGINDSRLEIQSMMLSDPRPNSFHLEQTAVVHNNNNYHPRLDAFNASLSLHGSEKDVPYAYITLPAIHASKTATSHVNQDVQITNLDAFNEYNAAMLGSKSVQVRIKGQTKLHEMRFPTTTVDYNKVVTMKGFNSLTGFEVTDFSIKLIPESDGTNMVGTVSIQNPTAMTLTMGDVSFDNYIGDTQTLIGNTTLTSLVLKPGNNSHPLRSKIDQTLVITELVKNYKDGNLPIDIVATSVVYNGLNIPYFELALGRRALRVVLDVGEKLKDAGIDFLEGVGL